MVEPNHGPAQQDPIAAIAAAMTAMQMQMDEFKSAVGSISQSQAELVAKANALPLAEEGRSSRSSSRKKSMIGSYE